MHTVSGLERQAGCARTRRVNTALIWAVVFAVCSLPVCAMAVSALWPSWRTAAWTTVSGTVVASHVEACPDPRHPRLYACRVEYRFSIDGKEHRGRRVRPVEIYGSIEKALEDEAKYSPGSACTIRVDPSNPESALLDPSAGVVPWALGALGLAGAAASSFFLLRGLNRPRPAESLEVAPLKIEVA